MHRWSLTREKPLNGGKGEAMGGKCKALRRNKRETNAPRTMAQHYVNVNVDVDVNVNVNAWMS